MMIDWALMVFMPLSMEFVSVFKGWTTLANLTLVDCPLVAFSPGF